MTASVPPVVSDARLDALIGMYSQYLGQPGQDVAKCLGELRQLRALAQTRQFGEREG